MLKRQYEDGYDLACDTLEETIVELDRLRKTNEVLRYENIKSRTMFDTQFVKWLQSAVSRTLTGSLSTGRGIHSIRQMR